MRTIIEIPENYLTQLGDVCEQEQISRAEAIRQAIALYLEARRLPDYQQSFGLWKARTEDGLSYQKKLRGEWDDRP